MINCIRSILRHFRNMERDLSVVRSLMYGQLRPGPFGKIRLVSERRDEIMEIDLLKYSVDLLTPTPGSDTVSQVIRVYANGEQYSSVTVAADLAEFEFEVPEDATCSLQRQFVDNKGNLSTNTDSQTFTAIDTIPPDAPGAFGEIKLLGERRVTVPDPTPAPEVPTDPAPTDPAPEVPTDPAPTEPAPEVPTEPAPEVPTDPVPTEPAPSEPTPEVPADPAPTEPEAPEAPASEE